MAKTEAETRYVLIDPVLRKGYRHPYINLETPAPVEPTGPKGKRQGMNLAMMTIGILDLT